MRSAAKIVMRQAIGYRLYEVAGGAHADAAFYPYIPPVADLRKIGSAFPFLASWPFANQCEPEQTLAKTPINTHVLDAAFANLTRWIRDGVAPPKAERIKIENPGTPQARIALDQHGNAAGGVRTAVRRGTHRDLLHDVEGGDVLSRARAHGAVRLDASQQPPMARRRTIAAKVGQSVDRLVRERWLTESDGKKIKVEAGSVPVSSSN